MSHYSKLQLRLKGLSGLSVLIFQVNISFSKVTLQYVEDQGWVSNKAHAEIYKSLETTLQRVIQQLSQ